MRMNEIIFIIGVHMRMFHAVTILVWMTAFIDCLASEKVKIAFLGDSITYGQFSSDWVHNFQKELPDNSQIVNYGRNGFFSDDIVQLLPEVEELTPDIAFILIGTNDIFAQFSPELYITSNKPDELGITAYRKNMEKIISHLEKSKIVLISIPPMGESIDSKFNNKVMQYNNELRSLAVEYDAHFINFNERLLERLPRESSSSCSTTDIVTKMAQGQFNKKVLGQSWNDISQQFGHTFNIDCLHINDRATQILIQAIVEELPELASLN